MERKATIAEQRTKLAALGFVRVDGLKTFRPGKVPRGREIVTIEPSPEYLGHWDRNNGLLVIHTTGGEVWLAINVSDPIGEERSIKTDQLRNELCPNGRGAFVPCSNGEQLSWRELLRRMSNPDW